MFASKQQNTSKFTCLAMLLVALLACIAGLFVEQAQAGGKGKGKGEEDIIMYNGNIVLRGDKKGGSIVMANSHPQHEEVEFAPSFFGGSSFGEMGGFRRRR